MIAYIFQGHADQFQKFDQELLLNWADQSPKFRDSVKKSLQNICPNLDEQLLSHQQNADAALYILNALKCTQTIDQSEFPPNIALGLGVGELNALLAAGAVNFEVGLRIVQKRAEILAKAPPGGMMSLESLPIDQIKNVLFKYNFFDIDVAMVLKPDHLVVTGSKPDIINCRKVFEDLGVTCNLLAPNHALHSRKMRALSQEYYQFLLKQPFEKLKIPVISNCYAKPIGNDHIREALCNQISKPVLWMQSLNSILATKDMKAVQIEPMKAASKNPTKIKKAKNKKGYSKGQSSGYQTITAASLGCSEFKKDYNLTFPYVTGAMFRGIASEEMLIRLAQAGMMGYFGAGGLELHQIEQSIQRIQSTLTNGQSFGINLLANLVRPDLEEKTVDLYLMHNIQNIEAGAYIKLTPALIRYRLAGLKRTHDNRIEIQNRILVKASRPDIIQMFAEPSPPEIVRQLLQMGKISQEQADLSPYVPVADDICVMGDSGGHTDQGNLSMIFPRATQLVRQEERKHHYSRKIRVGAGGGIGTPESAASAFMLGADFLLTGSINQCTVEAKISDTVKEMLQEIDIHDTTYAPSGHLFEIGAQVQVLKKGTFFPARAANLFNIYTQHDSIEQIDPNIRSGLEKNIFKCGLEEIYQKVANRLSTTNPNEIKKAEMNPKHKMALIFKWYFYNAINLALQGDKAQSIDYQVLCGPAMGAMNHWFRNTPLTSWQNRHVDHLGQQIIEEAAGILNSRFSQLLAN